MTSSLNRHRTNSFPPPPPLPPPLRVFSRLLILLLLLIAGVHPNPGPPPTPPPKTILQWNCNGLRSAAASLTAFLHEHSVKVACLQETKLVPGSKDPSVAGYTLLRRDRPRGGTGGGLAFLIHHSVAYVEVDTSFVQDPILELQGISATINNVPTTIINIYCPPASSADCPRGYAPDVDALLNHHHFSGDCFILGDWNAHHESWYSAIRNDRGDLLADAVESSDFCILNLDHATRIPPQRTGTRIQPTSPDVSLCAAHLALAVDWVAEPQLVSDHLPLSISFADDSPNPRRVKTYTNFKLANWTGYNTELDALVSQLPPPTSCSSGEKAFRDAILTASKHNIPAGYRKEFVPGRNLEAERLEADFNARRLADPQDPALEDLQLEIKRIRCEAKRAEWEEFVKNLDRRANPQHFWNTMKKLSDQDPKSAPNQPIRFARNQRTFSKPSRIAKEFNFQYTNIKVHKSSKKARKIKRNLDRLAPLDHDFKPFSVEEVTEAIKQTKNSSATGPDGITIFHLKHSGPLARQYLTDLYNLSIANADIPSIWKAALVLPVLKPNKPADEGLSYRPISLLCPASKVLERLLLPFLNESIVLDDTQHGFRAQRSPTTALLPLVTSIARGFNEQKPPDRTVAVAIDISKAFDSVSHDLLIGKILDSALHPNVKRWLSAFLKGRHQAVIYNGAKSAFKNNHLGVPQGAVLSPTLYNLFVASFPALRSKKQMFADDSKIFASGPIDEIEAQISIDLEKVSAWAEAHELNIAPHKSTVTLFSPNTHEYGYDPQVVLDGSVIATDQHPTILGLTLDPLFTFSQHARKLAVECAHRLRVLKAVAGTSWGQDQETLLLTYKALIRSKIDFAAPTWTANVSRSSLERLQAIQNAALRLATGCHKMASVEHLHAESSLLPVADHLQMLSAQFLASALRPGHPSHEVVLEPKGPRDMKETLHSGFVSDVAPYLVDGIIPPGEYGTAKKGLHTSFVNKAREAAGNNPLLQSKPPVVHTSSSSLPRAYQCTLSRLRSGFCSSLRAYQHRIGTSPSPTCPLCNAEDQTVPHLFACPAAPTDLLVAHLWSRPRDVARFLSAHPSFTFLPPLPPLVPPAPRPPPHPPPLIPPAPRPPPHPPPLSQPLPPSPPPMSPSQLSPLSHDSLNSLHSPLSPPSPSSSSSSPYPSSPVLLFSPPPSPPPSSPPSPLLFSPSQR